MARDKVSAALDAWSAGDHAKCASMLTTTYRRARSDKTRRRCNAELLGLAKRARDDARWKVTIEMLEAWLGLGTSDELVIAKAQRDLGWALFKDDRVDDAERACRAAVALEEPAQHDQGLQETLYNLSAITLHRGRLAEAERHARAALEAARRAEITPEFQLYQLARVLSESQRTIEAERVATEGHEIAQREQRIHIRGSFINMLANFALLDARVDEATELYEQALAYHRQWKQSNAVQWTLSNLAHAALHRDALGEANRFIADALAIEFTEDRDRLMAALLRTRGLVALEEGRHADAEVDLVEALAINVRLDHTSREEGVRVALGHLAEARGNFAEAAAHYAEAEVASNRPQVGLRCALAGATAERGNLVEAKRLMQASTSISEASALALGQSERDAIQQATWLRIAIASGDRGALDRIGPVETAWRSRSYEVRRIARRVRARG